MDEAKRIDIAGIRQHPWFSAPIPAMYENALKAMAAEQASISAVVDAQPLSKVSKKAQELMTLWCCWLRAAGYLGCSAFSGARTKSLCQRRCPGTDCRSWVDVGDGTVLSCGSGSKCIQLVHPACMCKPTLGSAMMGHPVVAWQMPAVHGKYDLVPLLKANILLLTCIAARRA
jgi:hypothetical protein